MNNWTTILTFTYPQDAHLAKSRLEADGIEVFIKDELSIQVQNHLSNALGGIKLQVRENQTIVAIHVLKSLGYNIGIPKQNLFWTNLNTKTAKIPGIGKLSFEIRLTVLVTLLSIVLAVPIYFLFLPASI